MFRFLNRFLFVFVVFIASAGLFAPVQAQAVPTQNTLTISEQAINTALQQSDQNPNSDFAIDLQPGQMVLNLTTVGQGGNTNHVSLTLVPSVTAEGTLDFEATHLTINNFEINLNNSNNAVIGQSTDLVGAYLEGQTGGGRIGTIFITDTHLTIGWSSENPNDPIVTITDNLFSITYTEAAINALGWVTNPTGEYVTGIAVDLQPGQAVFYTTRSIEPSLITYELIPTVINGYVSWQVNTQTEDGGVASALATLWRAYFGGIYGEGSMVDALITEDTVTFTWDWQKAAEAEREDSVVTYTIEEAEMNAALTAYLTPELTALSVDMQPGKIVLNAAGTGADDLVYTASITLVPELQSGTLSWRIEGFTVNGFTVDNTAVQSSDGMTKQIVGGLGNNQSAGIITDLEITDTMLTFTVQSR